MLLPGCKDAICLPWRYDWGLEHFSFEWEEGHVLLYPPFLTHMVSCLSLGLWLRIGVVILGIDRMNTANMTCVFTNEVKWLTWSMKCWVQRVSVRYATHLVEDIAKLNTVILCVCCRHTTPPPRITLTLLGTKDIWHSLLTLRRDKGTKWNKGQALLLPFHKPVVHPLLWFFSLNNFHCFVLCRNLQLSTTIYHPIFLLKENKKLPFTLRVTLLSLVFFSRIL